MQLGGIVAFAVSQDQRKTEKVCPPPIPFFFFKVIAEEIVGIAINLFFKKKESVVFFSNVSTVKSKI